MRRRLLVQGIAALPALAALSSLRAQTFPWKPVTIVVPYPPGGVTDIIGRVSENIIRQRFKGVVLTENKGGGTGVVAQKYVIQSPHDGHVLLTGGLGGLVLPPIMEPGLPIDPQRDFTPVAQVAEFANVLVVGKNVPATTVAEFIDWAKKQPPGLVNFGTNGIGTSAHFTSEFFNLQTGLKLTHVPYRSSGDLLVGLRNGDLQMSFVNAPAADAMLKQGSLKALGVTSSYRMRQLPDVPTLNEAGLHDFDVTSWVGLYAAKDTPRDIVDTISGAIVESVNKPESASILQTAGFEARPRDAAAFAAFNTAEIARWRDVAQRARMIAMNSASAGSAKTQ